MAERSIRDEHIVVKMTNRQDLALHLVNDHGWQDVFSSPHELMSAPDLLATHKGLHETDELHADVKEHQA